MSPINIVRRTALSLLIFGLATLSHGSDVDGDGIEDASDNCSFVTNISQIDADEDGFGNRCDPDLNNDNIVNFIDVALFGDSFLSDNAAADFNSDGAVNFLDVSILRDFF